MKRSIAISMLLIVTITSINFAQDFYYNAANHIDSRASFVNSSLLGLKVAPEIIMGYNRLFYNLSSDNLQSNFLLLAYPIRNLVTVSMQTQYFTSRLFQQTAFDFSVSKAFFNQKFGFGLDLGALNYSYRKSEFQLDDPDDPVFSNRSSLMKLDMGIGLFFKPMHDLYLGLAIKHLNRPGISLQDDTIKLARIIHTGVVYGHKFFTPFVSFSKDEHHSFWSMGVQRTIFQKLLLQGTYSSFDFGLHVGTNLTFGANEIFLGYQVTMPQNDLAQISDNSHQFFLAINFAQFRLSNFLVSVAPQNQYLYPGEETEFAVTVQPEGNFTSPVQLKAIHAEDINLDCDLQKNRLLPDQETKLIVKAGKNIQPKEYQVTILGESNQKKQYAVANLVIRPFPKLSVDIEAAVDTIIIEEITQITQTQPLLPFIFFEDNSYQLSSQKYQFLNTATQITDFLKQQIENDPSVLNQYRNVLNIIAQRLIENKDMKIKIFGYNCDMGSESKNLELSKQRAVAVKNYLIEQCGVNSDQIAIDFNGLPEMPSSVKDSLGQQENRRAEIQSATDDYEILAPLTLTSSEIKTSLSECTFFVTNLISESGIRNWHFILSDEIGDTIKIISGDEILPAEIKINMESKDFLLMPNKRYEYFLLITDNFGQSYQTFPKLIHTVGRQVASKKLDISRLIFFNFDRFDLDFSSGILKSSLEHTLIKLPATAESVLEIYGHTDIIGNKEYNFRLSEARAKAVAEYFINKGISPDRIKYVGLGPDKPLLNNSLPEGRMLNRRVELLILSDE